MNKNKLIIKGELADLNTYVDTERGNRYSGGKLKKQETERVYWDAKEQKLTPIVNYPVMVKFTWYSPDNRKDIDNVSFSKKFILDGLVLAKVLQNDSRKFVSGFQEIFLIDKENPRIEVEINQINNEREIR